MGKTKKKKSGRQTGSSRHSRQSENESGQSESRLTAAPDDPWNQLQLLDGTRLTINDANKLYLSEELLQALLEKHETEVYNREEEVKKASMETEVQTTCENAGEMTSKTTGQSTRPVVPPGPAVAPPSAASAKPIDYSKWDNLDPSDEEDDDEIDRLRQYMNDPDSMPFDPEDAFERALAGLPTQQDKTAASQGKGTNKDQGGARPKTSSDHAGARPKASPDHAGARPKASPEHAGARPKASPDHAGARPKASPDHAGARPKASPDHAGARPKTQVKQSAQKSPEPGPSKPPGSKYSSNYDRFKDICDDDDEAEATSKMPGGTSQMPGHFQMPGGFPQMPRNFQMPGGTPQMPGNFQMPGGTPQMPGNFQMPGGTPQMPGNMPSDEMSEEMKRILSNPEYKEVLDCMAKMENMPHLDPSADSSQAKPAPAKPKKTPEEERQEKRRREAEQKEFWKEKGNRELVEQFAGMSEHKQAQQFLHSHPLLLVDAAEDSLQLHCRQLYSKLQDPEVIRVPATQKVILQLVLQLARAYDADPKKCIDFTFMRLELRDPQYPDSFSDEIDELMEEIIYDWRKANNDFSAKEKEEMAEREKVAEDIREILKNWEKSYENKEEQTATRQ